MQVKKEKNPNQRSDSDFVSFFTYRQSPAAENLGRFYLSTVRCAVKRNTILPPQAATSSGFICFADYAVTSRRPSGPHAARRAWATAKATTQKRRRCAVQGGNLPPWNSEAGRIDDFLLKVPLSKQKNRRYATAYLRNSQDGVADPPSPKATADKSDFSKSGPHAARRAWATAKATTQKRRRCAVKRNTSSRRRRQLHEWSDSGTPSQAEWNGVSSQARLPKFGEDVKKTFGFKWSWAWRPSEVKTCVFVIFLPQMGTKFLSFCSWFDIKYIDYK